MPGGIPLLNLEERVLLPKLVRRVKYQNVWNRESVLTFRRGHQGRKEKYLGR